MSGKRVAQLSFVHELRQKAAELQAMAGAATDKGPFVKRNLERLAARLRTIAAQLAAELRPPDRTRVRRPGAPALYEGIYQELNSFGTPTGRTVRAPQGQQLPAAPHGFTWRLADRDEPVAVRHERRNRPSSPWAGANTGGHAGATQGGQRGPERPGRPRIVAEPTAWRWLQTVLPGAGVYQHRKRPR
jgi:hypothetical protein